MASERCSVLPLPPVIDQDSEGLAHDQGANTGQGMWQLRGQRNSGSWILTPIWSSLQGPAGPKGDLGSKGERGLPGPKVRSGVPSAHFSGTGVQPYCLLYRPVTGKIFYLVYTDDGSWGSLGPVATGICHLCYSVSEGSGHKLPIVGQDPTMLLCWGI